MFYKPECTVENSVVNRLDHRRTLQRMSSADNIRKVALPLTMRRDYRRRTTRVHHQRTWHKALMSEQCHAIISSLYDSSLDSGPDLCMWQAIDHLYNIWSMGTSRNNPNERRPTANPSSLDRFIWSSFRTSPMHAAHLRPYSTSCRTSCSRIRVARRPRYDIWCNSLRLVLMASPGVRHRRG